jgi:CHAT domain-containing protein
VEPYRDRAHAPDDWTEALDRTLGKVYEELLQPVDERLRKWRVKNVMLVPHRALHLLPLHACWHDVGGQRRYFQDDYQIRYAPSCTLAQICRDRAASHRALDTLTAIADPTGDLEFAAVEVDEMVSLFPGHVQVYPGEKARRRAVTASRPGAVLHFACHGRYEWDDPLASHLRLAGEDRLSLADLFDEQIPLPNTALAVLSACETDITDPDDLADEYLGLASGFLFAGTPTVVSTLWAVDDLSTALLMRRFYRELLQGGMPPSGALREAQIWLRTKVDRPYAIQHIESLLTTLNARYAQAPRFSEEQQAIGQQTAGLREQQRRLQHEEKKDPGGRPFAHPYYWAAFTVLTGTGNEEGPDTTET